MPRRFATLDVFTDRRFAGLPDSAHAVLIGQSYEMGCPSLIRLAFTVENGKLADASIGGDTVVVTQGTIAA